MLIDVQDLAYTYAPGTPLTRAALRGVSLAITPGERVGIVGHTGSGKSTLAQHLAGLLAPMGGRVLFDGVAIHERSAEARKRRRRVGLVLQYPEHQLFETSVYREVAFGPRNLGLEKTEIAGRVSWALGMVGLDPDTMCDRIPFTLSGGEMRRVALASILAMQPDVLILDEPTAGLDPAGKRDLLARLRAWQADMGLTLILISHDLGELARVVERVILLQGGKLIADGPVRQVLSDGEMLRASGLDVPQPVALLHDLRLAGWDVHTDRLLPEEAVDEIVRAWTVGGSGQPAVEAQA